MIGGCSACGLPVTSGEAFSLHETHAHAGQRPFCEFHRSFDCLCPYISAGSGHFLAYRRDNPRDAFTS